MTNSIDDLHEADVIFIIGSNTSEAHPVLSLQVIRALREGKTLIVADPRRIDLARKAHLHLPLKPGTNVALLKGMMRHIVDMGWEDAAFVAQRTENFDQFRESLQSMTVEQAAEICGVPADDIRKAAEMYAKAGAGTILYAMGITQHHTGTNNVLSIANLAMLTGNIGRPGTGVNPLRGQSNVQGACDMGGLPDVFSGYQRVDNPDLVAKMEAAWGVTLADYEKGKTVVEMMNSVGADGIRAMYVMGENPFLSDPDQHHVEEALKALEFLVVQDIFLTETAQFADVVLPAASNFEKDGTFTNTERRIQRVRKALEPKGESRSDWEIVQSIANRLGAEWNYTSAESIMQEVTEVTPQYGGVTYARLEGLVPDVEYAQTDVCGLQWPCPTEDHPGTPILHSQQFARGKGLFSAIEYIEPDEQVDAEFPFVLTTGRELVHYHTGTMTRQSAGLNALVPEGRLELNPADAARLGIEDGAKVRVSSRRGSIEPVAWVTDRVSPGLVFMPFHYVEAPANRLTNPVLDPIAKIPEFKVASVKVERVV